MRVLHLRYDGGGGISAGRDPQSALESDRVAGLRIVVQRLSERDAEREDEEHERDPDSPPNQLFAATAPAAVTALDWAERAHGP